MTAVDEISRCRSCGAEIIWLRGASSGRPAPIEARPSPEGNLHLDRERGTYHLASAGCPQDQPRYFNHFARCPQADAWRRPRLHTAGGPE